MRNQFTYYQRYQVVLEGQALLNDALANKTAFDIDLGYVKKNLSVFAGNPARGCVQVWEMPDGINLLCTTLIGRKRMAVLFQTRIQPGA